jgi:hypothetical protein
MATGAEAPGLTIDDAFKVLDKLGASRLEMLILVGGIPDPSDFTGCPPSFLEKRYPQILSIVEKKRRCGDKRRGRGG